MKVTIGGDRLGSGNNRKEDLHEYHQSSFNQEQDFKSSLAPGILYPFLCIPMTNGDSMDIDLDAFVRTLPTKGPLFGSFKLQADIFSVPMRLYNGVLHNNPIDIGMNMSQIYMPKLELMYDNNAQRVKGTTDYDWQVNCTSLLKYLGLSGVGRLVHGSGVGYRKINAIPILGYYDIFKNYYSNKQEEYAYVIEPGTLKEYAKVVSYTLSYKDSEDDTQTQTLTPGTKFNFAEGDNYYYLFTELEEGVTVEKYDYFFVRFNNENWITGETAVNEGILTPVPHSQEDPGIMFKINRQNLSSITVYDPLPVAEADIKLSPFALKNIDDMRKRILQETNLGYEFIINERNGDWDGGEGEDGTGLPYSALVKTIEDPNSKKISQNSFTQNGLVVKTYQSDIFQNWINTDWIEGENGIAAISAVDVSEGNFTIDALNVAQKVYNMLNRIALTGGTYEDWQEAVYTENAIRKAETPIYEGGMSAEVMFEEVISSAETNVEGDFQALGSLGGKGTMVGQKGGHDIHIKAREPIFVMGIVSLTPRICYTQGNEWYLTELNSFDDLHKPALDGIGFQDLITEQMAWWDSSIGTGEGGRPDKVTRYSAGKIVAWSNYMTAVDKAYGDFARPEGKGFMALSRNYEIDEETGRLKDCTTYIDPAKFNYAFAYTDLAAQNFWVQIHSKIVTRRYMSAHQIPNL